MCNLYTATDVACSTGDIFTFSKFVWGYLLKHKMCWFASVVDLRLRCFNSIMRTFYPMCVNSSVLSWPEGSRYDSKTEHGSLLPSPERWVKSLHHRSLNRVGANHIHEHLQNLLEVVFETEKILCQKESLDAVEMWAILLVFLSLVLSVRPVDSMSCALHHHPQIQTEAVPILTYAEVAKLLRKLVVRYLLGGSLMFWRLLQIVGKFCLILTAGLTYADIKRVRWAIRRIVYP